MSATAVCPEPLELDTGLTLARLLTRAHEDLQAYGVAECPICGSQLTAQSADAECGDCGSRLS